MHHTTAHYKPVFSPIGSLLSAGLFGVLLAFAPKAVALPTATDPVICKWKNDTKAALSFTFDDGTVDHFTDAAPMLEKYGLNGTFFINPNSIEKNPNRMTWAQVKGLAERGHEIGNHSMSHADLVKLSGTGEWSQVEKEIVGPIGIIQEKIGVVPVTFCYPFNGYNPQVRALAEQHHIATRLHCLRYDGTKFTTESANPEIDSLIAKGGDVVVMIHGIDPAVKAFQPFSDPALLDQHFAYVKSKENELWVDTFANVTRYKLTAATCEVKSLQNTPDLVKFELIGKEPNKPEKNAPLTLRIDRPKAVEASQGNRKLQLRSQGNATLCCEVLPNAGLVQVRFAP